MAKSSVGDLIDQLAFGKAAPRTGPCLGLYLSPEVIYIAETHIDEAGQVGVDHLVRVPIPVPEKTAAGPTATGTLNTDFLNDNAKLAALIRQSMGSIRWSTKDVVVTLSHHLGLLRYFTMPGIDRRYWNNAVPLEAKKYIPIPFDALSHDFQIVQLPPDAANKPRQGALIAVTQRRNLANISALLNSLGLKMLALEVAPCSALRLWEALDKPRQGKTHCQIHFDGGNVRILLADRGVPVFFRELFLGKEAQLGDLRKIDLGGCVAFSQKQLGVGQLEQVLVSGAGESSPHWQQAFAQEIGVSVGLQDTPARLKIKSGDWGGYAAIGASLRQLVASTATLDLGLIGRVTHEERRAAQHIFSTAGLLVAFFAGIGLYRNIVCQYKARDLAQYRRAPEIEAVFSGKGADEIDAMMKDIQGQARAASVVTDPVKITSLLTDIVNSLPDRTWITELRIAYPIIKTNEKRLEISIVGRAVAATMAAEQDLAFQYRDRLLKSSVVGKKFPDIQVSVTGKPINPDQIRGVDRESHDRAIENRTSFTVTMKKAA